MEEDIANRTEEAIKECEELKIPTPMIKELSELQDSEEEEEFEAVPLTGVKPSWLSLKPIGEPKIFTQDEWARVIKASMERRIQKCMVTLEDIAHGMRLSGPALVDGVQGPKPTVRLYPLVALYDVPGNKMFYVYDRVDENGPIYNFRSEVNEDVARDLVLRSFTAAWRKSITGVDETSLSGRTTQQSEGQSAFTPFVKPIRSQITLGAMNKIFEARRIVPVAPRSRAQVIPRGTRSQCKPCQR
jgi:hypothetical protein